MLSVAEEGTRWRAGSLALGFKKAARQATRDYYRNGMERSDFEVRANVPDGTVLSLRVNGQPVLSMIISPGEGEFEIAA